jgi:DNA-binding beta-propeller fold protein YncE
MKFFVIFLFLPILAFAQEFQFEQVLRIHNTSETSADYGRRDTDIYSPKSVRFSIDGSKFYVNSLEGGATLVYAWPSLEKIKTISHRFRAKDAALFFGETTVFDYAYFQSVSENEKNIFMGKPVESELSHAGRYLWVPYYRRDYDVSAQSPSALAIIDTESDEIVRVMPTGPLPKYLAASPDGKWMAVVQWGDNTVNFIDIRSNDYRDFKYVAQTSVENKLDISTLAGVDRDHNCGFCLRGAIFTPDSQHLLVARMGGGGIAGIEVKNFSYMGSLMNIADTPRHLVLSPDGKYMYVSSNVSGSVTKVNLAEAVGLLEGANGKRLYQKKWPTAVLGLGARTLEITNDGKWIFVALNSSLEVVMLDAETLKVVGRTPVDAYPVGLAISPTDPGVVITSQGVAGKGGNAVNIFRVTPVGKKSVPIGSRKN